MSSETLRKASALMRERAEWATPGPWEAFRRHDGALTAPDYIGVVAEDAGDLSPDIFEDQRCAVEDASHIASWHPAVALTVADWLDGAADWLDHGWCGTEDAIVGRAMRVALAYLGESDAS